MWPMTTASKWQRKICRTQQWNSETLKATQNTVLLHLCHSVSPTIQTPSSISQVQQLWPNKVNRLLNTRSSDAPYNRIKSRSSGIHSLNQTRMESWHTIKWPQQAMAVCHRTALFSLVQSYLPPSFLSMLPSTMWYQFQLALSLVVDHLTIVLFPRVSNILISRALLHSFPQYLGQYSLFVPAGTTGAPTGTADAPTDTPRGGGR